MGANSLAAALRTFFGHAARRLPACVSLHRLLLCECDGLVIELAASQPDRLLDDLAGCLKVLALFELHLSLDLLALDVWDEEGRHQITNVGVWLVVLLLRLVQELVDRLDLQLRFFKCLHRGGIVDGVGDNVLEVRVNRALIDAHQLRIEHVLALTQDFLSLAGTRLLSFTLSALVFSKPNHRSDPSLLL